MPRRSFRSGNRQRRPSIWGGGFGPPVTLAAGALHTITLVSNAAVKARTSPTIVRMRGGIYWTSTVLAGQEIVCGIIVVEESARAGGSMPNPETELEAPWLWWGYSGGRLVNETYVLEIDSKALRKMKDSQVLILRILNTGPDPIVHSEGVRVLLKD